MVKSMYGLLGFKQKVHSDWGNKILLGLKQKLYLDWSSKGLLGLKRKLYSDWSSKGLLGLKQKLYSDWSTRSNQTRIQAPSVLGLDQQGIQIKASNYD
jgi:hypothetical protein